MPERENLHTNAHTSRLREQTRTTLNYTAKDKRYAQTSDFAWAYNDVWAVPEIKTRFSGSHVGSAIVKSENLADPAAVPF